MVLKKPNRGADGASAGEKLLFALFDYQKFENEPSLQTLIDETERRYGTELPDDALLDVNAAGETVPVRKPKDPGDGDV